MSNEWPEGSAIKLADEIRDKGLVRWCHDTGPYFKIGEALILEALRAYARPEAGALLSECLQALPNASDENGMPLYEDLERRIAACLRSAAPSVSTEEKK